MLSDGHKHSCIAKSVEKSVDSAANRNQPAAVAARKPLVDDDMRDRWEK